MDKREQLLEIMEDAAKGETKATLRARIAALEAQLAEARSLVAEANNSLYGSHGYFHSTNGGEFDKYYLARPIEELKDRARRLSALEATPPASRVTEEMVDAGARAIAKAWGEDWECCCTERKGLDCDCGDAMTDDRYDSYDERLSREDCRIAARAALTAAQEAGKP